MTTRAAIYVRVSTAEQNTDNQMDVLQQVAERRGWSLVKVYRDHGISGAKGRDQRPGFDSAMKDATRRRYDVLMVWSIDRLGRSTAMVTGALAELEAAGVTIYADKEGMDGTSPHGRAMLQMAAVFGELERGMIRERVKAGIARAQAEQKRGIERVRADGTVKKAIGRPAASAEVVARVRALLAGGMGINRVAREAGCSNGLVERIKGEAAAA